MELDDTSGKVERDELDLSWREALALEICARCGICASTCPLYNVKNEFEYSPVFKADAFRKNIYKPLTSIFRKGKIRKDKLEELKKYIFSCTSCGMCENACPFNIKSFDDVTLKLRERCYDLDVKPEGVKKINDRIEAVGNPRKADQETKRDWTKGLEVKNLKEGDEIAYFVGCTASWDPQMSKIARYTAEILNKAGVSWGILGTEEPCCGSVAYRTGAYDLGVKQMAECVDKLSAKGVKKVIFTCPGCYKTIGQDAARLLGKRPFETASMVEFTHELIKDGKISLKELPRAKTTYHDPCHLGRGMGVYEAPREILKHIPGLEYVEMSKSKAGANCCGGGGGLRMVDRDLALEVANKRLEEAQQTGAEILATPCPYCEVNLSEAAEKFDKKIRVVDVIELVVEALQS